MAGFLFLTVTPKRFTASGKVGSATVPRFCTSRVAILISVPTLNVAVIELCPLEVLLLLMKDIPGEPLTCVSIAVVVVCSTVSASAPIKLLVIFTVGGVMSGYCAIGNVAIAIIPTNTITIEITMAVTGRLIKVSAIMKKLSGFSLQFNTTMILVFLFLQRLQSSSGNYRSLV